MAPAPAPAPAPAIPLIGGIGFLGCLNSLEYSSLSLVLFSLFLFFLLLRQQHNKINAATRIKNTGIPTPRPIANALFLLDFL